MLPNWIIIGVPKASTSSLFRWLVDHPQAGGSAEKETYYFVDPGTHMFRPEVNVRDQGIGGYEKLFAHCDPSASVVVEATPSYIYSETAVRELPKLANQPNFIVVLREPVAQLRSLHSYFQQNWNWIPADMGFRDFIEAIESGQSEFGGNELAQNALGNAWYPDHLRRWQAAAGAERLEIILFEDLVENSRAVMGRLTARMGIDSAFYDSYDFPVENSTYIARNKLLQSLNVRIRGRLSQGQFYTLLRKVYRALNTRRPAAAERDLETEWKLAGRFAPMLDELEHEFGLDLSRWRRQAAPRGAQDRTAHAVESSGMARPVGKATSAVL